MAGTVEPARQSLRSIGDRCGAARPGSNRIHATGFPDPVCHAAAPAVEIVFPESRTARLAACAAFRFSMSGRDLCMGRVAADPKPDREQLERCPGSGRSGGVYVALVPRGEPRL